ncbi:hypothetical protein L227DRAFT_332332 [Lentinus tigrinus ALCF2SS1-6]|uniref:Uncharacterized protein n=1 Tax=Lentinus tigrinus ALCF2SS1-6 TaxID=1328759 RepID=A0A5C2RW23_9APHY|nr:hypothetical protein L227DRAFT_332332 [Lentinus tigrinus ALCF2SS1-6]
MLSPSHLIASSYADIRPLRVRRYLSVPTDHVKRSKGSMMRGATLKQLPPALERRERRSRYACGVPSLNSCIGSVGWNSRCCRRWSSLSDLDGSRRGRPCGQVRQKAGARRTAAARCNQCGGSAQQFWPETQAAPPTPVEGVAQSIKADQGFALSGLHSLRARGSNKATECRDLGQVRTL